MNHVNLRIHAELRISSRLHFPLGNILLARSQVSDGGKALDFVHNYNKAVHLPKILGRFVVVQSWWLVL